MSNFIEIKEQDFAITTNPNDEKLNFAHVLRHQVFAESLNWIPTTESGLEIDEYDEYAIHFVVSKKDAVVGYCRIICGGSGNYMLEKEFLCLNPFGSDINAKGNLEITRMCTDLNLLAKERTKIGLLLCKGMFHFALKNDIRYWHVVVGASYLKTLNRIGFPYKPVVSDTNFDKKQETIYAVLDIEEAKEEMSKNNPALYDWFQTI